MVKRRFVRNIARLRKCGRRRYSVRNAIGVRAGIITCAWDVLMRRCCRIPRIFRPGAKAWAISSQNATGVALLPQSAIQGLLRIVFPTRRLVCSASGTLFSHIKDSHSPSAVCRSWGVSPNHVSQVVSRVLNSPRCLPPEITRRADIEPSIRPILSVWRYVGLTRAKLGGNVLYFNTYNLIDAK